MEHIKFAVINEDGEINVIYDNEESFHCVLLTEYIKSNGLDKCNAMLDFNDANNLSLFLREHGKIIFLNKTDYRKVAIPSESGIFVMPDILSRMQKESLIKFKDYITKFEEIEIWYDFVSHAECRTLNTLNRGQVQTILDYYVKELCNTKCMEKISDNKTK